VASGTIRNVTELTDNEWMRFALIRIREIVDRPDMTADELRIYTLATSALTGGDPVIPLHRRPPLRAVGAARSPGADAPDPTRAAARDASRLCRICGSEWPLQGRAEHVLGCPMTA
jgi:hypothetical protein